MMRRFKFCGLLVPLLLAIVIIPGGCGASAGTGNDLDGLAAPIEYQASEHGDGAVENLSDGEKTESSTDHAESMPEAAAGAENAGNTQETEGNGMMVCIDPGHFEGKDMITFEDGSYYCEGDVNLKIALKLRDILQDEYGISCIMTRTGGSIVIDGYRNDQLDSGHISLRGEMAEGCDLFVSIHTNANNEDANGCETFDQPLSINKTLVILNFAALENETVLKIANDVGSGVTGVNQAHGLCTLDFETNMDGGNILEWTDTYNDSLDTAGTVCKRTGSQGDYYGVLRGASNVNVPGFIVEHAFHSTQEVREAIAQGDIIDAWARADAEAIAAGLAAE